MSDTTSSPPAKRPNFSVIALLLQAPLLPLVAVKRLVTLACTFVILAMGRILRAGSEIRRHSFILSREKRSSTSKTAPAAKDAATDAAVTTVQIEDITCLICHEPIGTRNVEGVKEDWSMLPCGHRFGSHCIKRYLGLTADEQPLCPICRHVAYHDPCGHPVLPFLLQADGTHPDLVTDDDGKVRPPKNEEDLATTACDYCLMPDEAKEQVEMEAEKIAADEAAAAAAAAAAAVDATAMATVKSPGRMASVKRPLRWLRTLVPFTPRKKGQRASEDLDEDKDQDQDQPQNQNQDEHEAEQAAEAETQDGNADQAQEDGQGQDDDENEDQADGSAYERSDRTDRRLTRRELRNRRRAPANEGSWQGPWMDVQGRDEGWEKWWSVQLPRVAA
ncbi:uncharacterized protein C8A04DRAFT_24005 [Dichotomopilus funicola]|uniref:RING-type domain-containing protein n=1 Tax=Dichotomopilus funicola TaxID=1934379 RepID=A0AAN6ZRG4_9PEZI|nr:hypothetical protein C8A04DRAFT_24005 [Dichotomopilus funicola]